MINDNFEQKFKSCVLNAKNAQEGPGNQLNSLSTSKNELRKIFRGFRVVQYALW